MFRTFAKVSGVGAQGLFLFHPTDLIAVLELAWDRRAEGVGARRSGIRSTAAISTRFEDSWFGRRALQPPAPTPPPAGRCSPISTCSSTRSWRPRRRPARHHVLWDHLIYAYMIENTRIVEIFRRVVHEFDAWREARRAERRDAALAAQHRGAVLPRRAVVFRRGAAQRRRGQTARRCGAPRTTACSGWT